MTIGQADLTRLSAYRALVLALSDNAHISDHLLDQIVNLEADETRARRLVIALDNCGLIERKHALIYVPELEEAAA